MKPIVRVLTVLLVCLVAIPAVAQQSKPNILLIVSDDTGYGALGPYGGGEGRGMPTPNLDKMACEGQKLNNFPMNCPLQHNSPGDCLS